MLLEGRLFTKVIHLKIVVTVRKGGNWYTTIWWCIHSYLFLDVNCLSPNPQLPEKIKFPEIPLFPSRLPFLPLDVLVCFQVPQGMQKLPGSIQCQYPRCAAERPTAEQLLPLSHAQSIALDKVPNLRADTRAKVAVSSKGASLKWTVLTHRGSCWHMVEVSKPFSKMRCQR